MNPEYNQQLTPDKHLQFPEFVLVKASAGSGKTHALSLRFVQFLLSDKIPHTRLSNILAITFTKNAALEMKQRILDWLKAAYFQDPDKTKQILEVVDINPDKLQQKAGMMIDHILEEYTELQVETIDTFMTSIFKASTLDLGYSPDFKINLDNSELIEYAFFRYLRKVKENTSEGKIFREIVSQMTVNQKADKSFPWDPTIPILDYMKTLHRKLATINQTLLVEYHDMYQPVLRQELMAKAAEFHSYVARKGLEYGARSPFPKRVYPAVSKGQVNILIGETSETFPLNKSKGLLGEHAYNEAFRIWGEWISLWHQYKAAYAKGYYYPYLQAYQKIQKTLELVKRQQETVFLTDVAKTLSEYIKEGIVPDIYFRLGDRISHYLIDEFQDTSPIQWSDMLPLFENSLAQDGSLFVVGDTKQAIYRFRDADYRIMRQLEDEAQNPFQSAVVQVKELPMNYRSHERIVKFTERLFTQDIPNYKSDDKKSDDKDFLLYTKLSGLSEFSQQVREKFKNQGYVEIKILERDNEDPLERFKIQQQVKDLRGRGYAYSDIAILTRDNKDVTSISAWLNEKQIPFISYSRLDIRQRKIIQEIISLLRFLDSPLDNLAFATFILGDILIKQLEQNNNPLSRKDIHQFLFQCNQEKTRKLYILFQEQYPDIWNDYFKPLFTRVEYYPLYDLVSLIYQKYSLFTQFDRESASLVKFLEIIKNYEGQGKNDLQEFIELTDDEESADSDWDIDIPSGVDAVKVMSIHKAKGLGFPVVILLQYNMRPHPDSVYLAKSNTQVQVYYLNQDIATTDPVLKLIYDDNKISNEVDELNTLYVALTRAKAELYIIGVKGKSEKYPFNYMPVEDYPPQGIKPEPYHAQSLVDYPMIQTLPATQVQEYPQNKVKSLNRKNIHRGNIAHAILSQIDYLQDNPQKQIKEIIEGLSLVPEEKVLLDSVAPSIERILQKDKCTWYFKPREGRQVYNEKDYATHTGQLFRMDRVIIDSDRITVLDYKTGKESTPGGQEKRDLEYQEQIRNYISILKEIYPDIPVQGVLIYLDLEKLEVVA